MILAGAIGQEILKHDLVKRAAEVGDYLFKKLEQLQEKYPKYIKDLRGKTEPLSLPGLWKVVKQETSS